MIKILSKKECDEIERQGFIDNRTRSGWTKGSIKDIEFRLKELFQKRDSVNEKILILDKYRK